MRTSAVNSPAAPPGAARRTRCPSSVRSRSMRTVTRSARSSRSLRWSRSSANGRKFGATASVERISVFLELRRRSLWEGSMTVHQCERFNVQCDQTDTSCEQCVIRTWTLEREAARARLEALLALRLFHRRIPRVFRIACGGNFQFEGSGGIAVEDGAKRISRLLRWVRSRARGGNEGRVPRRGHRGEASPPRRWPGELRRAAPRQARTDRAAGRYRY